MPTEKSNDTMRRREMLRISACSLLFPSLNEPILKIAGLGKKGGNSFKIGDKEVSLTVIKKGEPRVTYFVPHGDEKTAFKAAIKTVKTDGGRLVAIPNDNERLIVFDLGGKKYKFDANRCFSETGIAKNLERRGNYSEAAHKAVSEFAKFLIKKLSFDQARAVIGVHNNVDGEWFVETDITFTDTYQNPDFDADDFFLVTEREFFDYLKGKNFNVKMESEDADVEGSLSLYCKQNKIPYVSVEAQHKHFQRQMDMLKEAGKMMKYCCDEV